MVGKSLHHTHRGNETGAETIELALAFPLVFFLVFAIIQLAIMGYSVLALTTATERAAWDVPLVELSQACSSGNSAAAEELVKNQIVACGIGLNADDITVSDVDYDPDRTRSSEKIAKSTMLKGEGNAKYVIRNYYEETIAGDITYTVTYTIPSLFANFPGLSDVTVSKTVTRERVQTSRTEIQ